MGWHQAASTYPLLYLLDALVDYFEIERYRSAFVVLGVSFVVAIVGSFAERLKKRLRWQLRCVVDRARVATPTG